MSEVSIFGPAWRERLGLISAVFQLRRALGVQYPALEELDEITRRAATPQKEQRNG